MRRVSDDYLQNILHRAAVGDSDGVAGELLDGEEPDGTGNMIAMSIVSELIEARKALTAADALADWLTEAINADECAPWPKVREALRAYRAARGT